jgi:predicted XRE-type DNA-binding protein
MIDRLPSTKKHAYFIASSQEDLRAFFALVLGEQINQQSLTQRAAALKLGSAQADVSRILNGKFTGYSLERLITLVQALGNDVVIKVKPAHSRQGRVLMRPS